MAFTDVLRNESHPITVHLQTRYGLRAALTERWHASVDTLAPVGDPIDAELAAHLGWAFELCVVADLAESPPWLDFLDLLDPAVAAGFLRQAGFCAPPGWEVDSIPTLARRFARWRKKPMTSASTSTDTDQFLGQAWIFTLLYDTYRHRLWDADQDSLRRSLAILHSDFAQGRGNDVHLRPLWDAYVERGRALLQSLGEMVTAAPQFVAGWARGDLILGHTC